MIELENYLIDVLPKEKCFKCKNIATRTIHCFSNQNYKGNLEFNFLRSVCDDCYREALLRRLFSKDEKGITINEI